MTNGGRPGFHGQALRLRHFRVVGAIAEHGSLLKAARALGTSQPAVTKVLREVEEAVGVPIFDRLPRGVMANDYGRAFIARVRRILGEIDRVGDDLARVADGQAGTIVVGALPSAASGLMPGSLARFRRAHPAIVVRVVHGRSDQLLPQLEAGSLDVVVGRLYEPQAPDDFRREVLYDEPISILCRAGHPILKRGAVTPAEIATFDLLLPSLEQRVGQDVERAVAALGFEPARPPLRSTSLSFIREMLLGSDSLAVLSRMMLAGDLLRKTVRIVPTAIQTPSRPAGLITLRHRRRSPGLDALAKTLRLYIRELRAAGHLS
ncbi:MAG TPA: LysR substrate-binding domain-containing protein [Alphaproteobacteria bacterium]|nr:LysR substrate-binding domain-containing protein [Alphaproteobacteria bacterium]